MSVCSLWQRRVRRRAFTMRATQIDAEAIVCTCGGMAAKTIGLARKTSREARAYVLPRNVQVIEMVGSKRFEAIVRTAGLEASVTVIGLCRTRVRLTVGFGLLGVLAGAIASNQLAIMLGVVGLVAGWQSVEWSLQRESDARKHVLEQHLSELIEVVCLGLRSGLSFDRALGLYCEYFNGTLSRELHLAQSQWFAGLRTRDEALRFLAATYDSPLFARMVDNIVRSMRFGSPLADGLEVLANEARQSHKAQVQEKVMKAPVKMMVPVGTLILPSMLILVLGPILLDLAEGF